MRGVGGRFTFVLGLISTSSIALWLWHCWCVFPWLLWNELRLEPSFLFAHGFNMYPGPGEGPVTTWMYGPLTPLLLLPATLASDLPIAMMTAGAINLAMVGGCIALVCAFWPAPPGSNLSRSGRLAAALLCVAAWPASSFQYIQADNTAVAFGLLGNLILIRSSARPSWVRWAAAAAAVAAIGCKQTALGVAVAQIVWVGWHDGKRAALQHAVRMFLCALALALAMVGLFGVRGLWLNTVEIPGHLPWAADWLRRIKDLSPLLAVHMGAPIVVFIWARRHIWHRNSQLLLPALSFVAAFIPGVASLFKIGGNLNSIQSLLLLLPPALVAYLSRPGANGWPKRVIFGAVVGIIALRFHLASDFASRPRTAHLHQAEAIVAQLPQQIWFPWNPLITFYAEGRFDHVEDGLSVRFLAKQPLTLGEARAHLPKDWRGMAMLRGASDWGLATHLCPPDAQATEYGFWTLHTWAPPK